MAEHSTDPKASMPPFHHPSNRNVGRAPQPLILLPVVSRDVRRVGSEDVRNFLVLKFDLYNARCTRRPHTH